MDATTEDDQLDLPGPGASSGFWTAAAFGPDPRGPRGGFPGAFGPGAEPRYGGGAHGRAHGGAYGGAHGGASSIARSLWTRRVGRCELGFEAVAERRVDTSDGCAYTKVDFERFYGSHRGTAQWDAAPGSEWCSFDLADAAAVRAATAAEVSAKVAAKAVAAAAAEAAAGGRPGANHGPCPGAGYATRYGAPATCSGWDLERRVDTSDGCAYTKVEFERFYGSCIGTAQWDAAPGSEWDSFDLVDAAAVRAAAAAEVSAEAAAKAAVKAAAAAAAVGQRHQLVQS